MNKFEKLIEYIINDEDQKARELFHDIVVEKSRDIYEDIMGEESMEETVKNDPTDIVDEISAEETMKEEEDEFNIDGQDDNAEMTGDFPADADDSDDGQVDGNPEEQEIEDTVMNIDAKLDELLAKFDEIMGEPAGEEGMEQIPGDASAAMGDEHGEEPMDEMYMEGEQPEWLKANSGKSGTSESGKSGKSGKSGASGASGKSGPGKMESRKTATELMREYTEKIADINLNASTYSEGEPVGSTGKKAGVNSKSITGPGADFGGTTATSKGGVQNQDGTTPTKASNEYNKGQGEIKSGNVNVPGGKAGKPQSTGKEYTKSHEADGKLAGNDGKVAQNHKSVQAQNTGKK